MGTLVGYIVGRCVGLYNGKLVGCCVRFMVESIDEFNVNNVVVFAVFR